MEQDNQLLKQSLHSLQNQLSLQSGEATNLKNRLFFLQTLVEEKDQAIQHKEESLQKSSTSKMNQSSEIFAKNQRIEQLEAEVRELRDLLHDERLTV